MQEIDISEAKIHLARLLEAAIKGAEIVITENGQPLVKIARVGINHSIPEVSEIDVISVTADLLNDHLPDRFCAGAPQFDRERSLWLVPVVLSYPKIGILGQVGQVAVSATAEDIVSFTPIDEMKAAASALVDQNREKLEARST